MYRKPLPADELLALIRARMHDVGDAPGACADCVPTQLSPVKPVAGGVNWQVLEHPRCSAPCQALMLDVCSALAEQYDVAWPAGSVRAAGTDPA